VCDDVRPQAIEDRRQLEEPEPRRLGHRPGRLSLDQHEHALVRLEAVLLDQIEDRAVAIEERRRAGDELELEIRMFLDRAHRALDARVVRSRADDDADLLHSRSASVKTVSAAMSVRTRRPTSSGRRCAGMPVPGFFAASIRGLQRRAGWDVRNGDDALLEDALHLRERSDVVLVDPRGEHRRDLAHPVHEAAKLIRLEPERRVGAVRILRQCEVLLDRVGAERGRCEARIRAFCVI